jgi:hypothetical protein
MILTLEGRGVRRNLDSVLSTSMANAANNLAVLLNNWMFEFRQQQFEQSIEAKASIYRRPLLDASLFRTSNSNTKCHLNISPSNAFAIQTYLIGSTVNTISYIKSLLCIETAATILRDNLSLKHVSLTP